MANDLRIQSILDIALKEFATMDFQRNHWEGFSIYCMMIACSFRTEFCKTFNREPSGWDRIKVGDWKDLQGSLTSSTIQSFTGKKKIHPDIQEFVKHYSGHTRVKDLETEISNLKSAKDRLEKKVSSHSNLLEVINKLETRMQSVTAADHATISKIDREVSYLIHKETEDMKKLETLLNDASSIASIDDALKAEIKTMLANIQTKLAIADSTGKTLAEYDEQNKELNSQVLAQNEENLSLKNKCDELEKEITNLKATTSSAPAPAVGHSHDKIEENLKLFFENAIFFLTNTKWKITQTDTYQTQLNNLEASLAYFKTNFETVKKIKNIDFFTGNLKNSQIFPAICTDYTSMFSEKEIKISVIEDTYKHLINKNKVLFKKLSGVSDVKDAIMRKEIENYLSKRSLASLSDPKHFDFSLLYQRDHHHNLQYIPTIHSSFFADVHSSRDMVLKESKIRSEYYLNMLQICVFLNSFNDELRINVYFQEILKIIPNKKEIPENYKRVLVYFFTGVDKTGNPLTKDIPLTKEFVVQICSTFSWIDPKVYFKLNDEMYFARPAAFLNQLEMFLDSLNNDDKTAADFDFTNLGLEKVD